MPQDLPIPRTLGGRPMEPVNLVVAGSRDQIRRAFRRAGWYEADRPTPLNLFRALVAVVLNFGYARGPVTPLWLDGRLQELAFQKPTRGRSLRRRHHVRLWPGPAYRDRPLWLASASYDNGIKLTRRPLFITHRIDPDLDHERDFIAEELTAGPAKFYHQTTIKAGRNAFGAGYRADGRVRLIELTEQ